MPTNVAAEFATSFDCKRLLFPLIRTQVSGIVHSMDSSANDGEAKGMLTAEEARTALERIFRKRNEEEGRNPEFRTLTIQERRERENIIAKCVRLGLAVDQIEQVLPNFGLTLKRSAIYNYLAKVKKPRSYATTSGQQSHHHYIVSWTLVEIVKEFNVAGYIVDTVLTNTQPEGETFRPDIELHVGKMRYFVEVQLSGISNTRWGAKHRNYLRFYERIKKPFRALFIIDQKGEMSYVRQGGKRVLRDRPELNLFYYATLQTIRDGDFVTKPVWKTVRGERTALVLH